MKKIISILLTVAVLFTCGISAFALFPDIVEQAPDKDKLLDKVTTAGPNDPGQNTNEGDIATLLVKLGIVDATEQSGLDNPITAQEAQNMAGRLAQKRKLHHKPWRKQKFNAYRRLSNGN